MPGYGLNRDPERTPKLWGARENAGFTTGTPWLPVADDYARGNVAVARAEHQSILQLHRHLIALCHAQPALVKGEYTLPSVKQAMMTYTRSHTDRRILIALNTSAEPHRYDLKRSGRVLLSTHLDRGGEALSNRVALRSHEGLIIALD